MIIPYAIETLEQEKPIVNCVIIVIWLMFDVLWLVVAGEGIGYWAHIAGLVAGIVVGLVCLEKGWIAVTDVDNRTLPETIKGQRRDYTSR
ncbi:MAG: rhomboid family intramembrane serine protease [Phycisphaerales bacterium]|nr:MAG: rhomboid family intramembrane serine protease [Phycisphaerales bacterium]